MKMLAAITTISLMLLVGYVIGWLFASVIGWLYDIADCIRKRLARRRNRDM